MPLYSEEMLTLLSDLKSVEEVVPLRAKVMEALALCDIHAAFFLAPLTMDPRVGRLLTNIGLPRVWERHYRARLHLIDPLPGLSTEYPNAFSWPFELDLQKLGRRQKRYLQIVGAYGLGQGIGVACYGPHGRAGFLGVQWLHAEPPSDRVKLAVHNIGQVSFQRYCQIMRERIDIPPLSNRELEVLGWMCRGRTNPQMAEIVGVSRSSIDAYIRRIFTKLKVGDRTAACVKAYSMGLTVSDEVARMVSQASKRDRDAPLQM